MSKTALPHVSLEAVRVDDADLADGFLAPTVDQDVAAGDAVGHQGGGGSLRIPLNIIMYGRLCFLFAPDIC